MKKIVSFSTSLQKKIKYLNVNRNEIKKEKVLAIIINVLNFKINILLINSIILKS